RTLRLPSNRQMARSLNRNFFNHPMARSLNRPILEVVILSEDAARRPPVQAEDLAVAFQSPDGSITQSPNSKAVILSEGACPSRRTPMLRILSMLFRGIFSKMRNQAPQRRALGSSKSCRDAGY